MTAPLAAAPGGEKPLNPLNPQGMRIVLVLQGGGALGAYQAGVYQALHEHGLVPDWTVGTSIGAINGALIAGNRQADRLARLKQFWERVAHPDQVDMARADEPGKRANIWLNTADIVLRGIPGFFEPRLFNPFALGWHVAPEAASFYDTAPLTTTLRELVDFGYLNTGEGMRLTINAVNVRTGELAHFDSARGQLEPDHVRASGALPPGFAPVPIDGELYWDGGLYSNTPLESVLGELPKGDTLCFLVDLWQETGMAPTTLDEVRMRQKDVTFASRSLRHIRDYAEQHRLQSKLRDLYERLPPSERTAQDWAELEALGCETTLHIVRLPYAGRDWLMASKDLNFSRGSIDWRWDQGYRDALRALDAAAWLRAVEDDTAVVVHELPPRAVPKAQ